MFGHFFDDSDVILVVILGSGGTLEHPRGTKGAQETSRLDFADTPGEKLVLLKTFCYLFLLWAHFFIFVERICLMHFGGSRGEEPTATGRPGGQSGASLAGMIKHIFPQKLSIPCGRGAFFWKCWSDCIP